MKINKKSILFDVLLTLITFGLWNIWVQVRQILDVNEILGRDEFSLSRAFFFSLISFGLYFCYHEYKMTKVLQEKTFDVDNKTAPFLCALATFFGLWFVVDSYQQSIINEYLERR
jgi:hypothetical protein